MSEIQIRFEYFDTKEISEFKINSGSLVFGTHTIDCNTEVQSECD